MAKRGRPPAAKPGPKPKPKPAPDPPPAPPSPPPRPVAPAAEPRPQPRAVAAKGPPMTKTICWITEDKAVSEVQADKEAAPFTQYKVTINDDAHLVALSEKQLTVDLPPGDYTASVHLTDAKGEAEGPGADLAPFTIEAPKPVEVAPPIVGPTIAVPVSVYRRE